MRATILILVTILANSIIGQPFHDKMLRKVVSINKIGKEIVYFKNDKEYGKLEYIFNYIGLIRLENNVFYKMVTRTLISGQSHLASNFIYVLTDKNKIVGRYRIGMVSELPKKIEDNNLILYDDYKKHFYKVYCGKGLPLKIGNRSIEYD